jgi:hypothetical protein
MVTDWSQKWRWPAQITARHYGFAFADRLIILTARFRQKWSARHD